jgi:hypothetical protein
MTIHNKKPLPSSCFLLGLSVKDLFKPCSPKFIVCPLWGQMPNENWVFSCLYLSYSA